MTEHSLFDEEEKTLLEGEALIASGPDPEAGWTPHFRQLLTRYKKLLSHARRLTNIGDLMQNDLKHLTERLKQAIEFQAGLLATAATGIFSVDADRAVKSVSDAFCTITGFSGEELIGKRPDALDFQPGEDTDEPFDCCPPVPVFGRAYTLKTKDGRVLNTLVNCAPMKDEAGIVLGGIVSFVDVTDLTEARKAAQAADRAKSQFLAVVSHEIRTPINGIVGMTELALGTELTAEQRGYLTAAQLSADALVRLINDILDLSRIEAGKMEMEHVEFSLSDCVDRVMLGLAVSAQTKGLELICRVPPDIVDGVVGDPLRLGQVLTNLVSNAIKFTDFGEILVQVSMDSLTADEVVLHFSVSDTGVGIAAVDQARIFGSFERARSPKTLGRPGTGLGLSICANLVQMMGGTIWVESRTGDGSTFHFTVSLTVPGVSREKHAIPDTSALAGLRVLVVEDNPTVASVLDEMLRYAGINPLRVDSAQAALSALNSAEEAGTPFRLILADARPDCLAGMLDHGGGQPMPPVVLMTSVGRIGGPDRYVAGRVAAFIGKPVAFRDLFSAMLSARDTAASAPETLPASPPSEAPAPSVSLEVLLADDDRISRQVAATMLTKMGHNVTIANDGVEAVSAYRKKAFDLIFMDVEMPEMRGIEATGAIREMEGGSGGHVPIVAMTAHAMIGHKEELLESGMDRFISKPVSGKILMETIQGLFPSGTDIPNSIDASAPKDGAFDRKTLMEQVCGERDLLHRILGLFLSDSAPVVRQIGEAIDSGDAEELRKAAHKLRGMVAAMAASKAEDAAFHLESLGRSGDLKGASEAMTGLRVEMDLLTTALSEFKLELDGLTCGP